ncbi:hypothetical protein M405DRAFT_407703 [Rhizopogon salebrosus TDB-379]|nr:hypothetical protein M405DRAFT_407703 [Rhizopogon salebrosus TDB-379]
MRAPPSFFGYQIFAALDSLSSACNLVDMMTLLLHFWLVSSGDFSFTGSHSLCRFSIAWSVDHAWYPTNR